MSSDIQFGELEHAEPTRGIRPDRDAHYCVLPVGPIEMPDSGEAEQDDLMIFVDLDVLRDMEAHANSDTSVELGGVMLGHQQVDEEGIPFVVISECLRAEHYHATKGSFKFTHDTWSQITERRRRHRPDLEMVGWYHTHPGWTVFLSGMDLFICNNFFNKPLDVALVIDPVNDDRGWFQWTDEARPVTRPTKGFYLMANRYRQQELAHFTRLYSKGPDMHNDPRYSDTSFGNSSPVVNLMDNRRPLIDFAIVAMLTLQFLVLGLLAWKMLMPPATPVATNEKETVSSSIDEARDEAYREILRAAVSTNGEDPGLVEKYTGLSTDHARLLANLDGQIARADNFSQNLETARSALSKKTERLSKTMEELELSRSQNDELNLQLANAKNSAQENGELGEQAEEGYWKYFWWSLLVTVLAITGVSGFLFGHRKGKVDAYTELGEYGPTNDNQSSAHKDESEDVADSQRITLSLPDEAKE